MGWDTLARKWGKVQLFAPVIGGLPDLPEVGTRGGDDGDGDGDGEGGGGEVGTGLEREIFRAVHKWRDIVAREEDESLRFVLQNHHLFTIAAKPPSSEAELLRLLGLSGNGGGNGNAPMSVVRRRAGEMVRVIRGVGRGWRAVRRVEGGGGKMDVDVDDEDRIVLSSKTEVLERAAPALETASELWGGASSTSSAKSSLLFGSKLKAVVQELGTRKSSLFGSVRCVSYHPLTTSPIPPF